MSDLDEDEFSEFVEYAEEYLNSNKYRADAGHLYTCIVKMIPPEDCGQPTFEELISITFKVTDMDID